MNTTTIPQNHSNATAPTSTDCPLVFQYETPHGHRYHVAGSGFIATDLRDATRYPVSPASQNVPLDPFNPDGGHLAALALLEIDAIEETALRASWGGEPLLLSPTNFHAEAFAIIRPRLDGLVTSGGTPFGSTLTLTDTSGSKRRGAILNVAFQLPPGVDELLAPLSPFGARTPREILTRIALLGLRLARRSEPRGFSIWERGIGGLTLRLETGLGCAPETLTLLGLETQPVVVDLAGRTFTELHPRLVSFIRDTKTATPDQTLEIFNQTFANPL